MRRKCCHNCMPYHYCHACLLLFRWAFQSQTWKNVHHVINSTKRCDVLTFYCYLCHVRCFICFVSFAAPKYVKFLTWPSVWGSLHEQVQNFLEEILYLFMQTSPNTWSCQKFHIFGCCKTNKTNKTSDMTKVTIKSENITSLGGIYHVMDVFSSLTLKSSPKQ